MSANITDKVTDTRNAARPNTATVSSTRSAGGTTLACNSLSGWPTASKVHFVTYKIDTNSNPIVGSQLDCYGIVSGNNIGSFTVVDGTDIGNSVGDVVEMLPTAAWGQDLADALTLEHGRTGAHNSTAASTLAPLIKTAILGYMYPIGSIYINATDSTNPATLLGFGTWTAFGAGRVPVGKAPSGTFQTAGATGGEETHALSIAELASHDHDTVASGQMSTAYGAQGWTTSGGTGSPWVQAGATQKTGTAGSGTAHNNLQPYIVCYLWQRTA